MVQVEGFVFFFAGGGGGSLRAGGACVLKSENTARVKEPQTLKDPNQKTAVI